MVVIITPIPPLIPAVFQLIHTRAAGQLADFFQNWFIHRLTVAVDAGRVYFECCKQNILFGIHDGQHIFEALRSMLTGIRKTQQATEIALWSYGSLQSTFGLLEQKHI